MPKAAKPHRRTSRPELSRHDRLLDCKYHLLRERQTGFKVDGEREHLSVLVRLVQLGAEKILRRFFASDFASYASFARHFPDPMSREETKEAKVRA